jgi:hypothetical protein
MLLAVFCRVIGNPEVTDVENSDYTPTASKPLFQRGRRVAGEPLARLYVKLADDPVTATN